MSPELINSVAALFIAIAVVGLMIQGWFIHKAVDSSTQAIQDVAKHTNSIKDELVAEVRLASFAKGELAGKQYHRGGVNAKEQPHGLPKEAQETEAKG